MVLDPYKLIGALDLVRRRWFCRSQMLEVQHTRISVAVALLVVYSTQLCRFGISKKMSVYLLCSCLYVYLSIS